MHERCTSVWEHGAGQVSLDLVALQVWVVRLPGCSVKEQT